MNLVDFTFEEFLQSRDSWDTALRKSVDNNIFLTWEWISAWWRFLGNGKQFLLAALTDHSGIRAAVPLMSSVHNFLGLTVNKIEFIGNPDSDYQGFLLTPGQRGEAERMIEHVCNRVPSWDLIELRDIPESSETDKALTALSTKWLEFQPRVAEKSPVIQLPADPEKFLESLGSRFRKRLRGWHRLLERNFAVDFKVISDEATVKDAMNTFISLHQKGRAAKKPPGIFSDVRLRDFHMEVASSFATRKWLVLGFLILNGNPAAALYSFVYANKMHFYQSGLDPDYSKYGVGWLLHWHLMEYCMLNGIKEYDFGRGDEPYKRRWGATPTNMLQFLASNNGVVPPVVKWTMKHDRLARILRRMSSSKTVSVKT